MKELSEIILAFIWLVHVLLQIFEQLAILFHSAQYFNSIFQSTGMNILL